MEKLLSELAELGARQKFNGEIDFGAEIASDSLLEVMKIVGSEELSQQVLEGFLEQAPTIHQVLLGMTFASYLQSTTSGEASPGAQELSEPLKKARRSIRLLLNLTQRSPDFASRISSESVELLETLLATGSFDVECLIILLKTSQATWLEFQKSPRYSALLQRVLSKYSPDFSENSTILAYFSVLFEMDYGFLSMCYAEMDAPTFCEILDVLRVILTRKTLKIHSNNLLFVLNLLELVVVDYEAFWRARERKEPQSVEQRRVATVEILNLEVEIVGEMCSNTEMTSYLNEKATAMNSVVDVLDAILHAEALFADFRAEQPSDWPKIESEHPRFEVLKRKIEEERRYEETQRRYPDRPRQPLPPKIQRVESSESLSLLANTIFSKYRSIDDVIGVPRVGELKLNCLKAIANLANLSDSNKLATLQNGRQGLISVLQCTTRRPEYFLESFTMRNQSIFCVRQLTDGCQENKEVVFNLQQPNQPIIDRKRLLEELGVHVDN
ncbi:Copper transport protein 86 [Caenorhabditis elegans]|uniref:Copper transport protein 86 n=1 Tax=Caenorhabditis elegans TaxID=6239 RepID=Q5ZEQ4_CAEEL|nr:Copper transport protein 86 [Caenorhabditis elegans]CAH60795.1 Copper transport protein 86 [Caenorhabditis elegans]|eukprot:NP_001021753.1 Uncharacterized protein CELE_Y37H9A.1 [Caenorhabditis elegans]